MWATRAWWMLRSMGFEDVVVLDCSFGIWKFEGYLVATGHESYSPATLSLSVDTSAWVDKKGVLEAMGDKTVCTINVLSPGVFSGEGAMSYGCKGHITGSKNVPYAALLNSDGAFKSSDGLRLPFDVTGALEYARIICSRGGGISVTMDALALTRLGAKNTTVYDGSISEWCGDPDLPMEIDAQNNVY